MNLKLVTFATMLHGVWKKIGLFSMLFAGSFELLNLAEPLLLNKRDAQFPPAQQVNIALRRTAHLLLSQAGDSTSKIAPVLPSGANSWQIRLENAFNYNTIPSLLQESLDLQGIHQAYDVMVLQCADNMIVLGYHQFDFLDDKEVPCGGRDMDLGCYILQISFLAPSSGGHVPWLALFGAAIISIFTFIAFRRFKSTPNEPDQTSESKAVPAEYISFGHSRLDVSNLTLECGTAVEKLTYREAKLLHLFATHPNQLLERAYILQEVWADEGILVGRSVDVFVSRLRKLLRHDASLSITAVHGVGYRLETAQLNP